MNQVVRSELIDYMTYEEQRNQIRSEVLVIKRPRRIHVGDHLTFLFENKNTIRYQVQEMMRTEKIVKEADILHELQTYNELLGAPGELGCTLLIEIDDEAERNIKLRAWLKLTQHLYMEVEGGARVRASFDERQVGDDRLSSVQYLKFNLDGRTPVAMGADLDVLTIHADLSEVQVKALCEDLHE
jgi:hypothetical protein